MKAQIMVISMLMLIIPKSFAAMQPCEEFSPVWDLTPACEKVIDTAIHKKADKSIGQEFGVSIGVARCFQDDKSTVLDIFTSVFIIDEGYLPMTGVTGTVKIKDDSCEITTLKVLKPRK